ncbi:MAG: hypothetical protein DDG59_06625 [Anaerolineae bacterium]|jgi:hypothetical protein|nr:MAG: hypothetical protein DDG59_06625 [Anaerolineae bacterium]
MGKIKHNIGYISVFALFMILTQIPYLYAAWRSDQTAVFSGFLFNPLDGNTYLSKMRQGWEGQWLFELTYSPEKSQPAFLFVFYLLLGHLSRVFHLDLVLTYHLARFVASLALYAALKSFFEWYLGEKRRVEVALFWALSGAGMGWLVLPLGYLAPDLWVAEGYGFLAAFANPHFPLAIAIMVWIMTLSHRALEHPLNAWIAFLAGLTLANLSPFAWMISSAGLGIYLGLSLRNTERNMRNLLLFRLVGFGLGGAPFLLYQFYIVRQDAVLAEWNRQNITPSPSFWLLLLGYLPLLLWAFLGGIQIYRQKDARALLPIIWIAVSLGLVYFPSTLQRRFMIGLYIPMVALAMYAFQDLSVMKRNAIGVLLNVSLALSMVTNLILLFTVFQAVQQHEKTIFLDREEVEAFDWLREHLPKDAVVLASPESGSFLPAWTGLRVVYGHPFESIHADQRKQAVEQFYQGKLSLLEQSKFLAANSVTAILWGMRERAIAKLELQNTLEQIYPIDYQSEQITIYRAVP